jgi:hypothetical protein
VLPGSLLRRTSTRVRLATHEGKERHAASESSGAVRSHLMHAGGENAAVKCTSNSTTALNSAVVLGSILDAASTSMMRPCNSTVPA